MRFKRVARQRRASGVRLAKRIARERRAAQEVLQIVLEAQENLQTLGVELWAASKYESAVQEALSGDAAYRERDFVCNRDL